jgi:TIR domain
MPFDIVVARFERYFRDPAVGDGVLRPGTSGIAVRNIWHALALLGVVHQRRSSILFDERSDYDDELRGHVRTLQSEYGHRVADGLVGPGTRKMLARQLLARFDSDIFLRLVDPEADGRISVFISYARGDEDRVAKIDQWLRDHGVRVLRDQHWFVSGETIPTNIANAIATCDKVLAVYSKNSCDRDWPRVEVALAEQVEERTRSRLLLYLKLDDLPLPQHDPHRLAISVGGHPLREVGQEILHAIQGSHVGPPRVPYDEKEPL